MGEGMTDVVNRPPHYTSHPAGVECIAITEHFDFVIGNIVKYAWRAGLKDGNSKLQDLEKCLWYAKRAVEREKQHGSQPAACDRPSGVPAPVDARGDSPPGEPVVDHSDR